MLDVFVNGVNYTNPIEGKDADIINIFINFFGKQYERVIRSGYATTTKLFLPKFLPDDNAVIDVNHAYDKLFAQISLEVLKSYNPNCQNIQYIDWLTIDKLLQLERDVLQGSVKEDDGIHFEQLYDLCSLVTVAEQIDSSRPINDWLNRGNHRQLILNGIANIKKCITPKTQQLLDSLKEQRDYSLSAIEPITKQVLNVFNRWDLSVNYTITNHILKYCPNAHTYTKQTFQDLKAVWRGLLEKGKNGFLNTKEVPSIVWNRYDMLFKEFGFSFENLEQATKNPRLISILYNDDLLREYDMLNYNRTKDLVLKNPVCMSAFNNMISNSGKNNVLTILPEIFNYMYKENNMSLAFEWTCLDESRKMTSKLCVFPVVGKLYDEAFYHELIHAIFAGYAQCDDKIFISYSGFYKNIVIRDHTPYSLANFVKYYYSPNIFVKKESNRYFNELFTDYLAKSVAKYAYKLNFHITDRPDGITAYQSSSLFFKNFFDRRKNMFVDFFLQEKPEELFEIIGQNNLEKLEEIAKNLYNTKDLNAMMQRASREILTKTGKNYEFEQFEQFDNGSRNWSPETAWILGMAKQLVEVERQIMENKKNYNNQMRNASRIV